MVFSSLSLSIVRTISIYIVHIHVTTCTGVLSVSEREKTTQVHGCLLRDECVRFDWFKTVQIVFRLHVHIADHLHRHRQYSQCHNQDWPVHGR